MKKYDYYAERIVPVLVEHELVLEEESNILMEYIRSGGAENA